jgi:hypothetical protein
MKMVHKYCWVKARKLSTVPAKLSWDSMYSHGSTNQEHLETDMANASKIALSVFSLISASVVTGMARSVLYVYIFK